MNENTEKNHAGIKSYFYEKINDRDLIKFKIKNLFRCKSCNYKSKFDFNFISLFPNCNYCKNEMQLVKRNFMHKTIDLDCENKFDKFHDKFMKYFVTSLVWEIRNDAKFLLGKIILNHQKNYEKIKNDSIDFRKYIYYNELKNRLFDSNDFNLINSLCNYSPEEVEKLFYENFKNLFDNDRLFKCLFYLINKKLVNNEKFNKELNQSHQIRNAIDQINNPSFSTEDHMANNLKCDTMNKINSSEISCLKNSKIRENFDSGLEKSDNFSKSEKNLITSNVSNNENERNLKKENFSKEEHFQDMMKNLDLYLPDNDEFEDVDDSIDEIELKNIYDNPIVFSGKEKELITDELRNNNDEIPTKILINPEDSKIIINNNINEIKNYQKNILLTSENFNKNESLEYSISTIKVEETQTNINESILLEKFKLIDLVEGNTNPLVENNISRKEHNEILNKIKKNHLQTYRDNVSNNDFINKNDSYSISRKKFTEYLQGIKNKFSEDEYYKLIKMDEIQYKNKLRIYAFKQEIINSIINKRITIIVSEPGSGKTTQIVQYCLNLQFKNFSNNKPIWCTQPRKVCCISVSERVSEEIHDTDYRRVKTIIRNNFFYCSENSENNIRKIHEYDDFGQNRHFKRNPELKLNNIEETTQIVFSTENVLLNLLIENPLLPDINILIIDEAHERSLNLDIVLYFLKNYTLHERHDFRLIITSATLNYKQFCGYFDDVEFNIINQIELDFNLFSESQRTKNKNTIEDANLIMTKKYKVLVEYEKDEIDSINYQNKTINFLSSLLTNTLNDIGEKEFFDSKLKSSNTKQFIENSKDEEDNGTIMKNVSNFLTILVFLPDTKTIVHIKNYLSGQYFDHIKKEKLFIFQLYGSLNYSEQNKIISFAMPNSIKLILSTNIAETSVTIPYCNIVVDTGLQKNRRYNYETKLLEDKIELISKDSAFQRQGRCGRIDRGICYKLYTKAQFEQMSEFRVAEISRVNISHMILKLIYFGISNVFRVKLIEQPSKEDIYHCVNDLSNLSAIEKCGDGDRKKNSFISPNFYEFNDLEQNIIEENYKTTEFGDWLYKIELEPTFGRVLYDCIEHYKMALNEILLIISSITVGDNLFSYRRKTTYIPSFIDVNNCDINEILNKCDNNFDSNPTNTEEFGKFDKIEEIKILSDHNEINLDEEMKKKN